ncbi:MAG: TatD family hydrolase [Brevinema sp.]
MFIDTHAHLDITFSSTDKNLTTDTLKENISLELLDLVIHISLDFNEFNKNYSLLKNNPKIFFATGIYPDRVTDESYVQDQYIEKLKSVLITYPHVALGEIGIDLKYESYGSLDAQKSLFRKQLELASDLQLPVVIHSRESFDECFQILRDFQHLTVIFHCFSYGLREADLILEQNNYISFSGILTYKKSIELQDVAKKIPLHQVLFETDSPYLSPEPLRSKKNTPEYVRHIYQYFAHLREIPIEELTPQIKKNVFNAFKFS